MHRLTLPDDGTEYDEWDTAFTTASDGSAVAVFGCEFEARGSREAARVCSRERARVRVCEKLTAIDPTGIEALTVRRLRVNSWDAATGKLLADWSAPPNAQFQNNPTIRTAGDYVAVALWGDDGNEPTAILMTVFSNETLFTHTSPGSMMAVDVVVDKSSAAEDTVLLNVAGKNVPANEGGTGGNAYVFEITVTKAS